MSALRHPTEAKDTPLSSDPPRRQKAPHVGRTHLTDFKSECRRPYHVLRSNVLHRARKAGLNSEASESEDPKQQGWKHTARILALDMACGAASLYLTQGCFRFCCLNTFFYFFLYSIIPWYALASLFRSVNRPDSLTSNLENELQRKRQGSRCDALPGCFFKALGIKGPARDQGPQGEHSLSILWGDS